MFEGPSVDVASIEQIVATKNASDFWVGVCLLREKG